MEKLTPKQAKRRGFTVDDTCYPWFAYKGPRFAPTESYECYTKLEAELLEKLNKLKAKS